jgi:CHAT domain-containing protein/tetratricopeptide (TPR) repeat protein
VPLLASLLLVSSPLLAPPAAEHETAGGIVVTEVSRGYEGARAGLQEGDVLLGWRQGEEHGSLVAPADLARVQIERAPRAPVRLRGRRGEQPLEVTVASDELAVETEPLLPPQLRSLHSSVAALARRATNLEQDVPFLRHTVQRVRALPGVAIRVWLLEQIGGVQAHLGRIEDMKATLAEARRSARESGDTWLESAMWSVQAQLLLSAGRAREAAAAQREAVAVQRARGSRELFTATHLLGLSTVLGHGEGAAEGRAAAEEGVLLLEREAPGSAALARALERLAGILPTRAERVSALERALAIRDRLPETLATGSLLCGVTHLVGLADAPRWVEYVRRGLAIQERLDPDTLDHATSLAALAAAVLYLGDIEEAEATERRALALRERLAPDSPHVADSLDRLGSIAMLRGNLAEAETLFRRAVKIAERDTPGTVVLAKKLQSLGQLSRLLGDLDAAQGYLERTLAVAEAAGADAVLATCLVILGDVATGRGEHAAAEAHYRRALALVREAGPDAPLLSGIEQNLGLLYEQQGRLDEAEALFREALARDERVGDRGRGRAGRHHALGDLALTRGDLEGAARHLNAALELVETLAPGTAEEAHACQSLATVARKQGRKEDAVSWLRRSVAAIEAQGQRLVPSPEVRARFRERHADVYRELEELLLELDRPDEALHVNERSRARALLAHLADRRLRPGPGVSPDLQREKRLADAEYDRLLAGLESPDGGEVRQGELRRSLEAARRRQDEVRSRIRAAAPRAASFGDPVPHDLEAVRRALEPGTLLLSYSVGPEAGRVYAVGPGPGEFTVHGLQAGEATIREEVRAFREAIDARRGPLLLRGLLERSERLSRRLLGPVAAKVGRAERLLIVPDGVLHLLPFAALADPSPPAGPRFLVEAKALHVASSTTLYAELARRRDAGPSSAEVTGFGDPVYPATGDALAALRPAVRSGVRLAPLPWSRREVESLREVSPGARLWLGPEATEARAKALDRGPRIIHFACHGVVDERFPFESGLALSAPRGSAAGSDNGLLQAWEVMESVHIDADLVTLSACQTGLGKETAGEGLLGLAWAFEYAGARSVLASLWEVEDASTAELMRRFYRGLHGGASKAEALRRAQLDLLRRPATSAPYFWAAFQLNGDGN